MGIGWIPSGGYRISGFRAARTDVSIASASSERCWPGSAALTTVVTPDRNMRKLREKLNYPPTKTIALSPSLSAAAMAIVGCSPTLSILQRDTCRKTTKYR